MVELDKIECDRGTQARCRMNPNWTGELVEVLGAGKDFTDEPEVYYDGYTYWPGDGFHRLAAYRKVGRVKVWVRVREGTHRDAMIHAAGANSEHGERRSRKDLRRAIALLLEDEDIAKRSDRTIARLARTTDKTVATVKKELGLDSGTRVYTDKHGNVGEMDVSRLKERSKGLSLAGSAPVNEFHQLPPPVKGSVKGLLQEISRLSKKDYAFLKTWLQAQLPKTPREASNLLTTLDFEEQAPPDADGEEGDLPI
jgi:hypothetical protein